MNQRSNIPVVSTSLKPPKLSIYDWFGEATIPNNFEDIERELFTELICEQAVTSCRTFQYAVLDDIKNRMKKIPAYTIEGYISEPDWGILGNQKRFRAKGIISFYTKAQYLTTLSGFYVHDILINAFDNALDLCAEEDLQKHLIFTEGDETAAISIEKLTLALSDIFNQKIRIAKEYYATVNMQSQQALRDCELAIVINSLSELRDSRRHTGGASSNEDSSSLGQHHALSSAWNVLKVGARDMSPNRETMMNNHSLASKASSGFKFTKIDESEPLYHLTLPDDQKDKNSKLSAAVSAIAGVTEWVDPDILDSLALSLRIDAVRLARLPVAVVSVNPRSSYGTLWVRIQIGDEVSCSTAKPLLAVSSENNRFLGSSSLTEYNLGTAPETSMSAILADTDHGQMLSGHAAEAVNFGVQSLKVKSTSADLKVKIKVFLVPLHFPGVLSSNLSRSMPNEDSDPFDRQVLVHDDMHEGLPMGSSRVAETEIPFVDLLKFGKVGGGSKFDAEQDKNYADGDAQLLSLNNGVSMRLSVKGFEASYMATENAIKSLKTATRALEKLDQAMLQIEHIVRPVRFEIEKVLTQSITSLTHSAREGLKSSWCFKRLRHGNQNSQENSRQVPDHDVDTVAANEIDDKYNNNHNQQKLLPNLERFKTSERLQSGDPTLGNFENEVSIGDLFGARRHLRSVEGSVEKGGIFFVVILVSLGFLVSYYTSDRCDFAALCFISLLLLFQLQSELPNPSTFSNFESDAGHVSQAGPQAFSPSRWWILTILSIMSFALDILRLVVMPIHRPTSSLHLSGNSSGYSASDESWASAYQQNRPFNQVVQDAGVGVVYGIVFTMATLFLFFVRSVQLIVCFFHYEEQLVKAALIERRIQKPSIRGVLRKHASFLNTIVAPTYLSRGATRHLLKDASDCPGVDWSPEITATILNRTSSKIQGSNNQSSSLVGLTPSLPVIRNDEDLAHSGVLISPAHYIANREIDIELAKIVNSSGFSENNDPKKIDINQSNLISPNNTVIRISPELRSGAMVLTGGTRPLSSNPDMERMYKLASKDTIDMRHSKDDLVKYQQQLLQNTLYGTRRNKR